MSKPERVRLDAATMAALDRRRRIKDKVANVTIGFGGVFVVLAITLIFVYLLVESWPLFKKAEFDQAQSYQSQQAALWVDMDEYNQTGIRLLATGEVQYFNVKDGQTISSEQLALPQGVSISHIQRSAILQGLVGVGLSNGQLLVLKPNYSVDVAIDGKSRTIHPSLIFPYGSTPLTVNDAQQPLSQFAIRDDDGVLQVFAAANNQVLWQRFSVHKEDAEEGGFSLSSAMDDAEGDSNSDKVFERSLNMALTVDTQAVKGLILGQGARWAYLFTANDIAVFRIVEGEPQLYQSVKVKEGEVSTVVPLQGEISLLVGNNKGQIGQWFLVRESHDGQDRFNLQKIRQFQLGSAPITAIAPEAKRKGFVAGDAQGNIGYFYTTSERTIGIHAAAKTAITELSVSARSEGVFVQAADSASFWKLHTEHPDISMKSTWGKVWYESYPEPSYTWQSTSGNVDFEGKMSLVPLTFGTLKAAFYAMLLAAPLAIFGA
ncbi:MAG: phosphate ABC transporter permease, partial [Pseudomonadales bacterium]|nr:phosphate ABC transporter permease [Pseudomonadales bacterium]